MLLVKSAWNSGNIVIDGKDNDWGDTMFYIKDAQLTAGVRNDSNFLYLVIKATDRQQAFQIMGLGLTIWFDPSGGSGQKLGIHFPLGRKEEAEYAPQQQEDGQNEDMGFMSQSPNELELLGVNDNGPVRLSIADAKGLELQINSNRQALVYELRVPLHTSDQYPYAINPKGDQIGIGFEGGKFEGRPSGEPRHRRTEGGEGVGDGGEGGDGGGEGAPGMEGGGMRRGGGEYQRGERGERPNQIDFWLKVNLAK